MNSTEPIPESWNLALHPEREGEVLAAVASCPHGGPVNGTSVPVSLQAGCGCGELYRCAENRGKTPGLVTTADCIACRVRSMSNAPGPVDRGGPADGARFEDS